MVTGAEAQGYMSNGNAKMTIDGSRSIVFQGYLCRRYLSTQPLKSYPDIVVFVRKVRRWGIKCTLWAVRKGNYRVNN